jgi:hypothetical protein
MTGLEEPNKGKCFSQRNRVVSRSYAGPMRSVNGSHRTKHPKRDSACTSGSQGSLWESLTFNRLIIALLFNAKIKYAV